MRLFFLLLTIGMFSYGQKSAKDYKVLKALEYPINKFYQANYYVSISHPMDTARLRKIANEIRKERKSTYLRSVFYFMLKNKKHAILAINIPDSNSYDRPVSIIRFDTMAIVNYHKRLPALIDSGFLPKNAIGYWTNTGMIYTINKENDKTYYSIVNPDGRVWDKTILKPLPSKGKNWFSFQEKGTKVHSYLFLNEYGDLEFYRDDYGFICAFWDVFHKIE
jgi:hypothetical protein